VTIAKSAARQGPSTEKNSNIRFCLNILNILAPTDEGRKPKHNITVHTQFTPRLGYTYRRALRALFCNTAASELLTEACICPNYTN